MVQTDTSMHGQLRVMSASVMQANINLGCLSVCLSVSGKGRNGIKSSWGRGTLVFCVLPKQFRLSLTAMRMDKATKCHKRQIPNAAAVQSRLNSTLWRCHSSRCRCDICVVPWQRVNSFVRHMFYIVAPIPRWKFSVCFTPRPAVSIIDFFFFSV